MSNPTCLHCCCCCSHLIISNVILFSLFLLYLSMIAYCIPIAAVTTCCHCATMLLPSPCFHLLLPVHQMIVSFTVVLAHCLLCQFHHKSYCCIYNWCNCWCTSVTLLLLVMTATLLQSVTPLYVLVPKPSQILLPWLLLVFQRFCL